MNKTILALLAVTLGVITYEVKHPIERFEQVAAKTLPTTVSIRVGYVGIDPETGKDVELLVSGAGVFVTPDGHILTCAHLFTLPYKRDSIITIRMYSGTTVTGRLVTISKKSDLALVRTRAVKNHDFIKLADPRKLKVGQEVIAIGSPLGLEFSVTHGIISALYRDIKDSYNVTQHDVFMNPGNSGGPVINLKGELVGINSFIFSSIPFFPTFTGLGFSVQSGQCLEFLVKSKNDISPHKKYEWMRTLVDSKGAKK